jgi:hypothetical protein
MRQCFVHCTLATPINDWLLIWAERQRTCHLRPNPAKRPKASPQWELLKAEQLAHNQFIAFKVRKEVQRQLQAHSRPALEHVHPLEHLPWVNRIKALAIHLTSWALLSKSTFAPALTTVSGSAGTPVRWPSQETRRCALVSSPSS